MSKCGNNCLKYLIIFVTAVLFLEEDKNDYYLGTKENVFKTSFTKNLYRYT